MHATIMCSHKCLFVIGSHHPGNPVPTEAAANENTIPGANTRKTRGVFRLVGCGGERERDPFVKRRDSWGNTHSPGKPVHRSCKLRPCRVAADP